MWSSRFSLIILFVALFGLGEEIVIASPFQGPVSAGERAMQEQRARDAGARQQGEEGRRRLEEAQARAKAASNSVPVMPAMRREKELSKKEKELLAPSSIDLQTHAEFLSKPGTGIFRLLLVNNTGYGNVVNIEDKNLDVPIVSMVGGGSYYSFTRQTHDGDKWTELQLKQSQFHAGFTGKALALLVNLGDVPIESVSEDSRGVDYLARLAQPSDFNAATQQFYRNRDGLVENGFTYKSSLPVELNVTYALRSTAYERADLLVVFRVARQDTNGSLVVIWKMLKKYSIPKFTR